jgi:hypothetical protein
MGRQVNYFVLPTEVGGLEAAWRRAGPLVALIGAHTARTAVDPA